MVICGTSAISIPPFTDLDSAQRFVGHATAFTKHIFVMGPNHDAGT